MTTNAHLILYAKNNLPNAVISFVLKIFKRKEFQRNQILSNTICQYKSLNFTNSRNINVKWCSPERERKQERLTLHVKLTFLPNIVYLVWTQETNIYFIMLWVRNTSKLTLICNARLDFINKLKRGRSKKLLYILWYVLMSSIAQIQVICITHF